MGQDLSIHKNEIITKDKELNTIHPIFLAANLTQIVVLLRGLEHQAQDEAYKEYALRLAANIWGELSDYGRNRIMTVSEQLNLNRSWFEMLEEKRHTGLYSSEANCSHEYGKANIIYFLKNGKHCTIEIDNGDGTEVLEDCLIKSHSSGNNLSVLHQGDKLLISIDSIISASEYGKCIY